MHHHHHQDDVSYTRAFVIGIGLNVVLVAVELGYGMAVESLALIADAVHNLSDVAALLIAFTAELLARRATTRRRTYGYDKATILASLIGAILLLAAMGSVIWEAIHRLREPQEVLPWPLIVVAGIATVINVATAMLFISGSKKDLNIRAAFLHMVADAAVSIGVVVGGIVILATGWLWVDPALSLAIAAVVIIGTWSLFRESLALTLDAVPTNIDLDEVRQFLLSLDGVTDLHDLHVWGISSRDAALTVHLVMPDSSPDDTFLRKTASQLRKKFSINHPTIQFEQGNDSGQCPNEDGDC